MDTVGDKSDDEYERELKLAVERYRNNQNPERKKDREKNEAVQVKKKGPKEGMKKDKVLRDVADIFKGEVKGYLKKYESQGAIPKRICNEIKSNDILFRENRNGGKEKLRKGRNSSQSPASRSYSCGRQFNERSVTREKNSISDKNFLKGNTNKKGVEVIGKSLQSFYYIVPCEPSPDFCLPPGSYYVVSKPIDFSIKTVLVCHPSRSEKDSSMYAGNKSGKQKPIEHFVVSPTKVNDINKSERNCSNVNSARDLISDYNSGECKENILAKINIVKSDLEADIEGFKTALMESTTALDQLIALEFSLNCKMSSDKDLGNKDVYEDFKGMESHVENDAEIKSVAENFPANDVGDEAGEGGGLDVDTSPINEELPTAQGENTVEDVLFSNVENVNPLIEACGEDPEEDMINNKIICITSVIPDISEEYLKTELEKLGGDENSINIFVEGLLEVQDYPKIHVDPDEEERKRLWKEYVTDFKPKNFLFEFFMAFPKGAATCGSDGNDDLHLVLSFLRGRYQIQPPTDLENTYNRLKNLGEVCKIYDQIVTPVKLSESGFEEEKFNKEFLLKVVYLDHEKEIDEYLSGIEKRKKLEREEAKLWNGFLGCLSCYDEIVPSETTTCSEGHVFCSDCVEMYIKTELGNGNYKFKCFSGECDASFDHKTLEELLPASVLSKISIKQQTEEIMKANVSGLESCSFCDFAYIPDPDDKIFKCLNPACMADICRNCRERSHIPLRCTEIERPKDVEARKKIEEAMTNTLVRCCPKCRKKIVKIDGCNKMTCTCGTLFCYLCQEQIYNYSHFGPQCPLHSNNEELHVRRVEEAGIKTRDELLRADQSIQIVHDPIFGHPSN